MTLIKSVPVKTIMSYNRLRNPTTTRLTEFPVYNDIVIPFFVKRQKLEDILRTAYVTACVDGLSLHVLCGMF